MYTLGVCTFHYNFDQNKLHSQKLKQERSVKASWIYHRRCLFCNKYKYFFSQGNNCSQHSVCIIEKNVQVPCVRLKACPVFNIKNIIINRSINEYRSRYICSQCFNSQGKHFSEHQERGNKPFSCKNEHKDDTTKSLKLLGQ